MQFENEELRKSKHLMPKKLEKYMTKSKLKTRSLKNVSKSCRKGWRISYQRTANWTPNCSAQTNTENSKLLKAHNIDAAKLDKLVNENWSLKESVVNIKNKFSIKQQNYIAAIEKANKGKKCDKTQVENEELQKSHQMMSKKLEDLASENGQLNKNHSETKTQLEKISSENSKLLEAHNVDIANIETLSEENSTLKASVDKLKHEFGIAEEMYLARIEKANNDLQQMKQLKIDLETQMQNMSVKQQLISTACQTDEWRVNANTKKVTSTNFVLRNKKTVITGPKSVSKKTAGIRQQPSVKKPAWKF